MDKRSYTLRKIASAVLVLSLLCSLVVAGQRVRSENNYRTVNISINSTDVAAFANAKNVSFQDALQQFKSHGASQILFKEISIGDLERLGVVEIAQGHALSQVSHYAQLGTDLPKHDGNYYIVINDAAYKEQIESRFLAKMPNSKVYSGVYDVIVVPTMIPDSASEQGTAKALLTSIGVGFDQERIQETADAGMGVVAQIRSWDAVDDYSFSLLKNDLRAMPNLALIIFNDKSLPGYPKDIDVLADVLKNASGAPLAPIGMIEFNEQKGLNQLALRMDKDVVRLHTISNAEMSRFEGESDAERQRGTKEALDRWSLAADERNMRALLVRFFEVDSPGQSFDENLQYLDQIRDQLEKDGFTVGGDVKLPSVQPATWLVFLVGLGVCAGVLLLLLELKLPRLAVAGAALTLLCWIGLLLVSPILARKLMAIGAAVVFPTLSCIHFLPAKPQSFLQAVLRLLSMCVWSFAGAILLVGLLSETLFMLKLDQFVGVKLVHVIPIVIVPLVLYIWQTASPMETLRGLWQKTLDYKWLVLFGIMGAALMIYVTRTGNTGAVVSAPEAMMRQFLTDTMGVRPRSKEFLIGYPATILFLMYGKKLPSLWPLSIAAVIGQVSLVNTYAHIHTPLVVSLLRSVNGLVLGLVVSFFAVAVIEVLLRLYKKHIKRQRKKEA